MSDILNMEKINSMGPMIVEMGGCNYVYSTQVCY